MWVLPCRVGFAILLWVLPSWDLPFLVGSVIVGSAIVEETHGGGVAGGTLEESWLLFAASVALQDEPRLVFQNRLSEV